MPTDTITEHITTIDFGQTLETMIAAGKYDWLNANITADNFPAEGTGIKKFRTKLFHFDRNTSSEDAVAAILKEKFLPGGHVHGLAYGATFPEEKRKYPIACLGSSAQVYGIRRYRRVVCLYYWRTGERRLDLCHWLGVWPGRYRFLGVQEVSGA